MRIIIDARMYQQSGIGRYLRNLVNNLQEMDHDNEYFILYLKEDFDKVQYQKNFHKVLADFKWYDLTEQRRLPKILNDLRPDLVHFPHFNVPVFFQGKFIVTIHDLIHQHFSMKRSSTLNPLIYFLKQAGYKKVFKFAIEKSLRILTPSNFVKNQLIDEWNINSTKIEVTYEAVDDKMLTIVNKMKMADLQRIMQKFNIQWRGFIFYVGNAHPHKNVEGLIKAFRSLPRFQRGGNEGRRLLLVLSGQDHYFWQRIRHEFQNKDIIYTGALSDEELVALYKGAEIFIMPSFEEGFGLSILEAMACGTPVLASNIEVLREVGGEGAYYFDPESVEDIAGKVTNIIEDKRLREDLVRGGYRRYKMFSWKKLAKKTLEVYRQCG